MKIVLVFAAFVAIAVAAPLDKPEPIRTIQLDERRDKFGQFFLTFRTENGITVVRQGELQPNAEGTGHVLVQSGSETYTAPNGQVIKTTWVADKEGYRVMGEHLPVAPELPAAPELPSA